MRQLRTRAQTTFYATLLFGGMLIASSAQGASIGAGSLFSHRDQHIAYGADLRAPRNELRLADGRYGGNRFKLRSARGVDAAVPEPGAALLFGLGALAVARTRRRA